jgi:hypothetical protein
VKSLNNKANPIVPENRQRRPVALTGLEFRPLDEDVASLRRHTYVAGNRRQRRRKDVPGMRLNIRFDRP